MIELTHRLDEPAGLKKYRTANPGGKWDDTAFAAVKPTVRRQLNRNAERLEDVRAAGLRGNRAVAVFGDGDTRGSDHERDGCRNVESVQPVAPGAADVEDFARARLRVDRGREGSRSQFESKGGDFSGRLAFASQRGEKIRFNLGRDLFIDELSDRLRDLIFSE